MPKTKVLLCETCRRNRKHVYKGERSNPNLIIPSGIIGSTIYEFMDYNRATYWECTKCGEIFVEDDLSLT